MIESSQHRSSTHEDSRNSKRPEFNPSGDSYDWRKPFLERRQKEFKRVHDDILTKYGDHLPEVDNKLQVVTVVPAYRELQNNNFWRLLQSLSHEAGTHAKILSETLYVVNNRVEDAKSSTLSFQENQNTLHCLYLLQTAQKEFVETGSLDAVMIGVQEQLDQLGLTEHEKTIFKESVESGVRIFPIDASSKEFAVDDKSNSGGQARNIGGHIALERLKKARKNNADPSELKSIIDFIDADCAVSKGYYSKLVRKIGEEKVLFKSLYAVTPDISEYVEKEKNPEKQLAGLIKYLKLALLQGRSHYFMNTAKNGERLEQTGHGPSITVEANLFKEVGGYPNTNAGEDFLFNSLIQAIVKPGQTTKTDVRLNLSHRSREDSFDGYELGKLVAGKDFDLSDFLKDVNASDLQTMKSEEVKQLIKEIIVYINKMLERDKQYSDDPVYVKIRANQFEIESRLRKRFVKIADSVIDSVVQKLQTNHEKPVKEYEYIVSSLSDEHRDFLLANPSILEAIITASLLTEGSKNNPTVEVKNFFRTYIPEYFALPTENEPDYEKLRVKLSENENAIPVNSRDLIHIARAVYLYENRK